VEKNEIRILYSAHFCHMSCRLEIITHKGDIELEVVYALYSLRSLFILYFIDCLVFNMEAQNFFEKSASTL
jgi:hypothetical protein